MMMTKPSALLEFALYVKSIEQTSGWYQSLFHFPVIFEEKDRLCALQAGAQQVLLLFKEGATTQGTTLPGGFIPGHDASGPAHLAFSMDHADIDAWKARLGEAGVAVESTVTWPGGNFSYYFRDPDNHLVELITPGQWKWQSWPPRQQT